VGDEAPRAAEQTAT